MVNEDIERLKKKIEKDPLSKFFVPLAEEYKKKGMVDEAINVLLNALKNRPDYTSARVALGKIYLHKGMLSEAQDEFEKVIKLIPNNLLAHRRLADIYYKQEKIDRALAEYQNILNLTPNDEEAKAMILELKPPEERVEPMPTGQATDSKDLSDIPEQYSSEKHSEKTKETPVYEISEEVNSAELEIEIPEKLTPVPEEPVSKELQEFRKIMGVQPDKPSTRESVQEQSDLLSPAEEIQENHHDKVDTTRSQKDKITISMPTETLADIFITQELYDKAMNIYKEILSSDPENKRIIQRCEELKMLIKLKDKKP